MIQKAQFLVKGHRPGKSQNRKGNRKTCNKSIFPSVFLQIYLHKRVTNTGNVQTNLSGLTVDNTLGQFWLVYYLQVIKISKSSASSQVYASGISAITNNSLKNAVEQTPLDSSNSKNKLELPFDLLF